MIGTAITPKLRRGKCRVCHEQFQKTRSIQPTCEKFECKVAYAERVAAQAAAKRVSEAKKKAAAGRKELRVRKEAIKKRGDWLKEAQAAFNAFRREWCRVNGFNTCPCCDQPLDWTGNNVDAGHYRSVGSAPHMRFVEDNVWAQRKQCNRYGAGRAVDYRIGLIKRCGIARVEEIEADNTPRKYSIDDLKAIKAHYKNKLKELKGAAS